MSAATITEGALAVPSDRRRIPHRGPARLVSLLAGVDSPLTVSEAAELVASWL